MTYGKRTDFAFTLKPNLTPHDVAARGKADQLVNALKQNPPGTIFQLDLKCEVRNSWGTGLKHRLQKIDPSLDYHVTRGDSTKYFVWHGKGQNGGKHVRQRGMETS